MVKTVVDIALERCQFVIVAHKAIPIEIGRGEFHLHDIVMAVQTRALMIGGQTCELVRGGKVKFLGDAKHQAFLASVAVRQKSASS